MSAQPDPSLEPIDLAPTRDALRRILTDRRERLLIPDLAQAFAAEANRRGASLSPLEAERIMNAVAAPVRPLKALPRWLAESLAVALTIDPTDLRPEGAPTPLRAVPNERKPCPPTSRPSASPSSVTRAGKGTARTATDTDANVSTTSLRPRKIGPQGNHDDAPSAGDTSLTFPSVATPPASPAIPPGHKRCKGCPAVLPVETGFYVDRRKKDGHAVYCKPCMSKRAKEWRESQSPAMRARARERNRLSQAARVQARRAS